MSNGEDLGERGDRIIAGFKKNQRLGEEAEQRNKKTEQGWKDYQLTKAEWDKFFSVYQRLPKQPKFLVNVLGLGFYNGQREEDLQGIFTMKFSPGQAEEGKKIFQEADITCRELGLVEYGLVPRHSVKTTERDSELVDIYQGEVGRHLSPANHQAVKVVFGKKPKPT